jgi:hypothetical protein
VGVGDIWDRQREEIIEQPNGLIILKQDKIMANEKLGRRDFFGKKCGAGGWYNRIGACS